MNEEIQKQTIRPTRTETIFDVLNSLVMIKGNSRWAVATVIFGVISLGWLASSSLPILQDTVVWLYSYANSLPFENKFGEHFLKLCFPLALFLVVVGWLIMNRERNAKALEYNRVASEPHRGLIISLSDYKDFSKLLPKITDLETAIDGQTLDVEIFFNTSNWGQLAFVAAHHSPLLQRCWVVTTPKSSKEFSVAAKLIKYVSLKSGGRETICDEIKIKDENDIGQTATQVSLVYKGLDRHLTGLNPDDVIANFTGGTAAMSGGIILATLDEGRKIEYVSQKHLKNLSLELLRNNRTDFAIVSPETNLVMAERLSLK